jgi:hypothetical protein
MGTSSGLVLDLIVLLKFKVGFLKLRLEKPICLYGVHVMMFTLVMRLGRN